MKAKYFLFLFTFILGFSSCNNEEKEETPPPRTLFVYMVASDLGSYLKTNIEQMISVATNKNLNGGNLIVYYSEYNSKDDSYTGELFQIKEGKGGVVTRHHIRDYTGDSAVDPQFMRSLVREVFTQYPADSYGVLLSSHATAWFPTDYRSMTRSFGEENGKRMEVYDLATALDGFDLEFLAVDACSMGAVECAYELRGCAKYYISSTGEIMGSGFPFKEMLPYFFARTPDYENIVLKFHEYYLTYTHPYGNLTVVKNDALNELAAATREILADTGVERMETLRLNDYQVLSFIPGSPTKLYDFEDIMMALATTETQRQNFKQAMSQTVVNKSTTDVIYCSGYSYTNNRFVPVTTFSGLTVYPFQPNLTQLNSWYQTNLSWYKDVF